MDGELVKRLRERSVFLFPHHGESRSYDADLMHEAADAIEELSKPRWIPVTERLPCLTTPVLVTDGIEVDIAWMYGVPPRWITSYTAIDEDKLTHWMPLPKTPQPPKEE